MPYIGNTPAAAKRQAPCGENTAVNQRAGKLGLDEFVLAEPLWLTSPSLVGSRSGRRYCASLFDILG
jgi:hypothetical protein